MEKYRAKIKNKDLDFEDVILKFILFSLNCYFLVQKYFYNSL